MDIQLYITDLRNIVLGWPLMLYIIAISIIFTLVLRGVQIRSFFRALRIIFAPAKPDQKSHAKPAGMTPTQAFINTLSSNLGNGSIAGVATALYAGGPGSAIWLMIVGMLLMAVRFVEVYASTLYATRSAGNKDVLGGPVNYLRVVPGGSVLATLYVVLCFLFSLAGGNGSQANSIRVSIMTAYEVNPFIIASGLFLIVLYIVCGGSKRILRVSDSIVPLKVLVFVVTMSAILLYHWAAIIPALALMIRSAFSTNALVGGLTGFSVMQALRFGMTRAIFATESGLGTAAVLFGSAEDSDPYTNGLMGMTSTFLSTLFCFIVMLCIVASGVWDSGLTSTALTIASINTVFGSLGSWLVTFLSCSFGLGVIVTYAYIARISWLHLTGGKWAFFGSLIYCVATFLFALIPVDVVWAVVDLVMAGMLIINLFGLLWLLPRMVRHMRQEATL